MADDHLTVAQSIIDAHINERIRPHFILCTKPEDGREVPDDQAGGGVCWSRNKVAVNLEYDETPGDPHDAIREANDENDAGEPSGLPTITFAQRVFVWNDWGEHNMILSFHMDDNPDVSAASIALTYDLDVELLDLRLSKTAPSSRRLGLNKLLCLAVVLISRASNKPVCLKAGSRFTVLAAIDTGFAFDTECKFPKSKTCTAKRRLPQYEAEYCYKFFIENKLVDIKNEALSLNAIIEGSKTSGNFLGDRRNPEHPLHSTNLLDFLAGKMFLKEPDGYRFAKDSSLLPMIYYPENESFSSLTSKILHQAGVVVDNIQRLHRVAEDTTPTPLRRRERPGNWLQPSTFSFPEPKPITRGSIRGGGGTGATMYLALFASAAVLAVSTLVGSSR